MLHHLYIVDDDKAVRESLYRLVYRKPDYYVRCYPSGDAFLAERDSLESGVVLLDFHMPGSSGQDVLDLLHASENRFVTVMLTAHGAVERSVDAMKAGAYDFLEKPYEPSDLMLCLDDAFAELDRIRARDAGRDAARSRMSALSRRETEVLEGMIDGASNKEIARALAISPRTVEIYRAHLMEKLNVRCLADVLRVAFAAGHARAA